MAAFGPEADLTRVRSFFREVPKGDMHRTEKDCGSGVPLLTPPSIGAH